MEIRNECAVCLADCYKELFFGPSNRRCRAMTGAELRNRLSRLNDACLEKIIKPNELSDIHAMLAKVCAFLMHKEGRIKPGPQLTRWEENCRCMEKFCEHLAKKDLEFLPELTQEELEHVLKMQGIRRYLLTNSLERAYQLFYIPKTIKKGIRESVKRRPEDEYPETRAMKRRFILHIGPTNSGKTHDALERLKQAEHGAYFGPLRLLALEVYDRLNSEHVPCSMITGEETLEVPGAVCQACTVEMLNDHEYFDVAVVDECQMAADPYRGHNWTRAVLGLRAEEIHLCMAPEAEDIMVQMIKRCGDSFQIVRHKRSTRLTLEKKPYSLKRDLKKGDALIVFSKKSVLALAAHLENQGVRCSVIYGSLPPATRREQVRRFLERETEVVVSTDAIGMGLNLPIRRIVFVETRKFDGTARRSLLPEEIRQIAGRAGRFGLYDEGFVTAIDDIETIEDGLSARPLPIMKAYVGFPEQLLNLPAEIDTLVKIWAGMEAPAIYEKMEVDELLSLYMSFERIHGDHLEEFTKQEIYKLITCSVDIDNRLVMDLWKDYCREYREVDELEFPTVRERIFTIWKAIIKCWIFIFSFHGRQDFLSRKKTCSMKGGAQRRRSAVSCAQNAAAIPGNVPSAAESFPGIIHFPSVSAALSGAVHRRSALVFTISGITIKTHTTGSATMIPQYLKISARRKAAMIFPASSIMLEHMGVT